MIRKLLFLPFILLFISCSVTKRVHRPGFHIQWHKIHRTQSIEKQERKQLIPNEVTTTSPTQEIASQPQKLNQMDSLIDNVGKEDETKVIVPIKPPTRKRFSQLSSIIQKTEILTILKTKSKKTKTASHTSRRPIFWRMSAKSLKSLGRVLVFLGVLILLGAMMSAAGAFSGGGGGSGAWVNFFLDLIEISQWFWLLAFILVIVLLLYLSVLLVRHVFGGTLISLIIALPLLALGIFFHTLGKNREIEA